MSSFKPFSAMTAFAHKVRSSIQSWRRRKLNQIFEDSGDQLMVENLEIRLMLDGDSDLEEFRQDSSFHHLPAEVGAAIAGYFNPYMAAGSTEIWQPKLPSALQGTENIDGSDGDRVDLEQHFGGGLQTVTQGSTWASYEPDPNGLVGSKTDSKVSLVELQGDEYLVIRWHALISRSINLSSTPSGQPGFGQDFSASPTPTEEVHTILEVAIGHTDNFVDAEIAKLSGELDVDGADRFAKVTLDHKFKFFEQGGGNFEVKTDFKINADFSWVGDYQETETEKRTSDHTLNEPLGTTTTTYQYDVGGSSELTGFQEVKIESQAGPGGTGPAKYTYEGDTQGEYGLDSYTTVLTTFDKGDADNFVNITIDSTDDYVANGESFFNYYGEFEETTTSKGSSGKKGDLSTSLRGKFYSLDNGTTTFTSVSHRSYDAQKDAAENTDENEGGGETTDKGEEGEVGLSKYVGDSFYTTTSSPNLETDGNFNILVGSNYEDGEQKKVTEISFGETTYTAVGATSASYSKSTSVHELEKEIEAETDASKSSSTSNSKTKTSFDKSLTDTLQSDGKYDRVGHEEYTTEVISADDVFSAVSLYVGVSAVAGLRNENKEHEGKILQEGSRSFVKNLHSSNVSAGGFGGNEYLAAGNSTSTGEQRARGELNSWKLTDPPSDKDRSIGYAFSSILTTDSGKTESDPGFTKSKTHHLVGDKGKVHRQQNLVVNTKNSRGSALLIDNGWGTYGSYADEDGSKSRKINVDYGNWSYGNIQNKSTYDLVDFVELIEVDHSSSGAGDAGDGGAANVGGDDSSSSNENSNKEVQITTDGESEVSIRKEGYSYLGASANLNGIRAHLDKETSDGYDNHQANNGTSGFVITTKANPLHTASTKKVYTGSVSESDIATQRKQTLKTTSEEKGTTTSHSYGFGNKSVDEESEVKGGDPQDGQVDQQLKNEQISATAPTIDNLKSEGSSALNNGGNSTVTIDKKVVQIEERKLKYATEAPAEGPSTGNENPNVNPGGGVNTNPADAIPDDHYSYETNFHKITIYGKNNVTVNSTTTAGEKNRDYESKLESEGYGASSSTLFGRLKQIFGGEGDKGDSTKSVVSLVHSTKYDTDGIHSVTNGTVTDTLTLNTKVTIPTGDDEEEKSGTTSTHATDENRFRSASKVLTGNVLTADDNVKTVTKLVDFGSTVRYNKVDQTATDQESENEGDQNQSSGDNEAGASEDQEEKSFGSLWEQYLGIESEVQLTGTMTVTTDYWGSSSSDIKIETRHDKTSDTSPSSYWNTNYGPDGVNGGYTVNTESFGHTAKYKYQTKVTSSFQEDGTLKITSQSDAKKLENERTEYLTTSGDHYYYYKWNNHENDLLTTKRNGNYSSNSGTKSNYEESGSFHYTYDKEGELADHGGSLTQTYFSKGDSIAKDEKYVGKSIEKTGTFSLGDIAQEIQSKVASEFTGGGTRTGTVKYEIEANEGQDSDEHYDGQMSVVTTGVYDAENKEAKYTEDKTYSNRIWGKVKETYSDTHMYEALQAIGATPSDVDTVNKNYDHNLQAAGFDKYEFLGFKKLGYGSVGYRGGTIDVPISAAYTNIGDVVGKREGEATGAAHLATGGSETAGALSSYQQTQQEKDEKEEDDGVREGDNVIDMLPSLLPSRKQMDALERKYSGAAIVKLINNTYEYQKLKIARIQYSQLSTRLELMVADGLATKFRQNGKIYYIFTDRLGDKIVTTVFTEGIKHFSFNYPHKNASHPAGSMLGGSVGAPIVKSTKSMDTVILFETGINTLVGAGTPTWQELILERRKNGIGDFAGVNGSLWKRLQTKSERASNDINLVLWDLANGVVPGGAASDAYAKGDYVDMLISLAGDAATFATLGAGLTAKIFKMARVSKKVLLDSKKARLVLIGVQAIEGGGRLGQGAYLAISKDGNKGQAMLYIGEAFLRLYGLKSAVSHLKAPKNVVSEAVPSSKAMTNGWIHFFMGFAKRKIDVSEWASKVRLKYGVEVILDAARSSANKWQIFIGKKTLKAEPWEELIHYWQHNGKFKKAIKKLLNSDAFEAIPGTMLEKKMAAYEIQAKTFLVNHARMFNMSWYEVWVIKRQLARLWKTGITKGY